MGTTRILLAAIAFAFSTALALAASVDDQVKAAYTAWNDAFNKADAQALSAAYEADAVFLPMDHNVYEGPAGVEKFFGGMFSAGVTGHTLDLIKAYDQGDTVVAAAKWTAQGKDDKGNPATFSGVATHVFKKQPDGSLKLLVHSFN
jgi:uncharacterized protein (TIGR02246 family)